MLLQNLPVAAYAFYQLGTCEGWNFHWKGSKPQDKSWQ